MSEKIIIDARNVWKKYMYGQIVPYFTLVESIEGLIKNPFKIFAQSVSGSGLGENEFWALQNVNFKIKKGEVLGIIGKNGSGKSTLLKILSRITPPTRGEIKLRGRVSSLLEVGTGFQQELTGRENIFLNGAILGMTQREITKQFEEIVEFAEVGKFLDTPVKHYSSGMYVRLAFSVAAHLQPEILIVDEVLAVGDTAFQKKCLGKMGDVARLGRTILFVSHNMEAVKALCNRCFLLDQGRIVADGLPHEVINKYLNKEIYSGTGNSKKVFVQDPKKDFQILSVQLLNKKGQSTSTFNCDEPITIELTCMARTTINSLYGYLSLFKDGNEILVSDTSDKPVDFSNSLVPGKYKVSVEIPSRSVGHGDYDIYLKFGSQKSLSDINFQAPQYICSFHLDDNTTRFGNRRGGYFSTLLRWNIKPSG